MATIHTGCGLAIYIKGLLSSQRIKTKNKSIMRRMRADDNNYRVRSDDHNYRISAVDHNYRMRADNHNYRVRLMTTIKDEG